MSYDWQVEIAFPTDPLSTPTYTDVTAYSRGYGFRRGRSSEVNRFDPASGYVLLDNADRRFEPNYASSPYASYIIPRRRIRKSLEGQVVFTGVTDTFPAGPYDGSGVETVSNVKTFDLMYVLARAKLNNVTLPASSPATSTATAIVIFDSASRADAATLGNAETGGAWTDTNATGYVEAGTLRTRNTGVGLHYINAGQANATVSCRFPIQGQSANTQANGLYVRLSDASNHYWVTVQSTDDIAFMYLAIYKTVAGVTTLEDRQAVTGNYNGWPAIQQAYGGLTLSVSASGNDLTPSLSWWGVDGALQTFTATPYTDSFNNTATRYGFGRLAVSGPSASYDDFKVTAATAAVGNARVNLIANLIGWPAADRVIAAGTVTMSEYLISGTPTGALDLLRLSEEAEGGQLYCDHLGRLVFEDALTRTTQARSKTSQATFGDQSGEIPYTGAQFMQDVSNLVNELKVQPDEGSPFFISDQSSIKKYLLESRDITPHMSSAAEMRSAALIRLNRYREPVMRAEPLALDGGNPTVSAQLAAREISDLVTLYRRPNGGTAVNAAAVKGFVEEIAIDIGEGLGAINGSLTLSPQRLSAFPTWGAADALWDTSIWGP